MFDPQKFEEWAKTVASEATEGDTALSERRTAEAELLTRVIDLARPALKAIGTRPVIRYHIAHHADVNYNGGARTEERYTHRCVPLSASEFGPEEDCPRANEGTYGGKDLALREDGALVQIEYSGDWSRWQGSSWGYEAEITEYDSAADALADGWTDVDEYIEQLSKRLEAAVGKRKGRVEADRARAEKLAAIRSLLKK
jgi:hypothetical protein